MKIDAFAFIDTQRPRFQRDVAVSPLAGDHAHAESPCLSLNAELTRRIQNERRQRTSLTSYMRYYYTIRVHSGVAFLSPLAFERRAA